MLPRQKLSVSRPQGGVRDPDSAKWIPGDPKLFAIRASVQPLRPVEIESLPEGRRTRAAYTLFTSTLLQTINEDNPDQVTVGAVVFEVMSCAAWLNGILPHYKAVISQMEIQPQ